MHKGGYIDRTALENTGWRLLYLSFIPLFLTMATRIIIGVEYNTPVLVVEGYHALVDTAVSGAILLVVYIVRSRYASRFQYGLYRLEDVTAFTVAVLILVTLAFSLGDLRSPPTGNFYVIIAGQTVTIPFLLGVMYAKKRAGELLNSSSLRADAAHMTVDVIESSAVVAGLILYYYTQLVGMYYAAAISAVFGLLVAAYEAGYDSLKSLLDLPRDEELMDSIRETIKSCINNVEIVDIKVRWAGPVVFSEALLRMHPLKTIDEAGEICSKLERCVKERITEIRDIIFRLEPSHRNYYKLVVPADEESTEAEISHHFAKAKYYYIAEIRNGRLINGFFIRNNFLAGSKETKKAGRGQLGLLLGARIAEYFHNNGVTDVVVTNIGEIAFALFLRHQIVVWKGVEGLSVTDTVGRFLNGELERLREPTSEASWEKHVV